MDNNNVKLSKTISYALRHRPEEFGLKLDSEGWVNISDLISSLKSHSPSTSVTKEDIDTIINESEKKRFEISGEKIRATYGHSVERKIEFEESVPPDKLFHGTSFEAAKKIYADKEGILPMERQYVHLSSDVDTAIIVGKRHMKHCAGDVVLFTVDAKRMHDDGFRFIHSANDGTWMCDRVPFKYITMSFHQ